MQHRYRDEPQFIIVFQKESIFISERTSLENQSDGSDKQDKYLRFQDRQPEPSTGELTEKGQIQTEIAKVSLMMDQVLATCVMSQLLKSHNFLQHFIRYICTVKRVRLANQKVMSVRLNKTAKNLKLSANNFIMFIHLNKNIQASLLQIGQDLSWSNRMVPQINVRIHLEDAFSWLSTLGGAYSSLGDTYIHCSSRAGKISLQQLYLAWSLGEPFLESRCKLFLAQSLMQRGYLRQAKKIIRQQYKFAKAALYGRDERLVTMCLGTWHRLKYFYELRRERRARRKGRTDERNGLQIRIDVKT
ncbi:uncharacterized protein [Ptychodera flava]|uniref:uncharacterized protein n=1 Tax=Ptychodera flava TaxID=63121 RepID=UPI003969D723